MEEMRKWTWVVLVDKNHRNTEYPELKGTLKDHHIQLLEEAQHDPANEHLQLRRPVVSWAASKEEWPAD